MGRERAEEDLIQTLHDEHAAVLWSLAVRSTGDPGRAQDVVQEVLLRAWRHPEAFDPARGSARAWLVRTLRNVLIDEWRARAVRDEVLTADPPEQGRPGGADDVDAALQALLVADALGRLTAQHREVLVECFYLGHSVGEAAARLGVPAGTVKSRTHYALRALRLTLDEMGGAR